MNHQRKFSFVRIDLTIGMRLHRWSIFLDPYSYGGFWRFISGPENCGFLVSKKTVFLAANWPTISNCTAKIISRLYGTHFKFGDSPLCSLIMSSLVRRMLLPQFLEVGFEIWWTSGPKGLEKISKMGTELESDHEKVTLALKKIMSED